MGESYLGYRVRDKLYPGEQDFFRQHPDVAGMAADDGAIIFNPWAPAVNRDAVGKNEAVRLWIRDHGVDPLFSVTAEQKARFVGTPYARNPQALRQTLMARYLSGDPSAGSMTPEQAAVGSWLNSRIQAKGARVP